MMSRSTNQPDVKLAKTVGTKLTPREHEEISNLIEAGVYLSVSDFIRDAVRDKLMVIKVIKIREINYQEAKEEVLGYYRNYQEAYDYEVAEDLELDYELVVKITEELKREGRLEVVG